MLSTNYGHEPLSGESFDNNQGQMLHSSSGPMGTSNSENNSGMKGTESASANAARSLRIKPQPNQVLKCPRCHSMNTKFCYYNNYSLTQPRHFCKNCRRYWTKGGALRNVPVGGGCRKNKRAKQKNASESPQSIAQMEKNGLTGSFSSDSLVGSLNQQENNLLDGCSTSNLFSYQQQGEDDPVGMSYRLNHGHGLGLADYSSFPIPRSMQISGPPPFSAHLGLQGFESGLAGLNFNPSALKHAHASVYDPSSTLSLLSAAASTPPPLSESLAGYGAMNLDGFVALGLQSDSKWKLHHKLASNMVDSDRSQDHSMVLQGLQLNNVAGLDPKSKSEMLGLSNSEGMNNGGHGVSDWQAPSHDGFMETSADSGYWPPHSWPQIDLPVYSSEAAHQFCDVKPPAAAPDPDFYSRASRCSI